jgi:hypothetical protein
VRILVWDNDASLVLIILGSAMPGVMLTFLASLGPRLKRAPKTRLLEETIRSQDERLRELEGIARKSRETSPA